MSMLYQNSGPRPRGHPALRSTESYCRANIPVSSALVDFCVIWMEHSLILRKQLSSTRKGLPVEYGVDTNEILTTSHGRRSIDVFRSIDPSRATVESICLLDSHIPILFGHDAEEIPGARRFLDTLARLNAPRAIVTSGTRPLVDGRLKVLSLAEPCTMVMAEAVNYGKPDPECYKLGAQWLGLAVEDHALPLVLEGAAAGVRAGKPAGSCVLAVATTHSAAELREAGADFVILDPRSLDVLRPGERGGCFEVHLKDILA